MTGHSTNDFDISIIVPVLNEIKRLPGFLSHLERQWVNPQQIIVVDGGSTDGSWAFLKQWKQGQVIQSAQGRAIQMNAGASIAKGQLLYFVHVDSQLPKDFDQLLLKASGKGFSAGCFRLDFDHKKGLLHLAARGSRWNFLCCRGGDQSLFIKKTLFTNLGGFDESYRVCEDLDMIRKLYQKSRFIVLPQTLITSSRKFYTHGITKILVHFRVLHLLHGLGFKPDLLWSYYQRYVK